MEGPSRELKVLAELERLSSAVADLRKEWDLLGTRLCFVCQPSEPQSAKVGVPVREAISVPLISRINNDIENIEAIRREVTTTLGLLEI